MVLEDNNSDLTDSIATLQQEKELILNRARIDAQQLEEKLALQEEKLTKLKKVYEGLKLQHVALIRKVVRVEIIY